MASLTASWPPQYRLSGDPNLRSNSDFPQASSHAHQRAHQGPNPRAFRQDGRAGRGVDGCGGTASDVNDPPRRSPTSQSRQFTLTFVDAQKQHPGLRRAQTLSSAVHRPPKTPSNLSAGARSRWRVGAILQGDRDHGRVHCRGTYLLLSGSRDCS